MRQLWHKGRALDHLCSRTRGREEGTREFWAAARELGFSAASMAEASATWGKAPQGVDGQAGNAVTAARPRETVAPQRPGIRRQENLRLPSAAVVFRQKRLVFGHKRQPPDLVQRLNHSFSPELTRPTPSCLQ